MLTKTTPFAAAALAAALGAATPAWAETYQLDFDAPREVGDRFQMRGNGSSMEEVFTRVDGQTVSEEATHGEAFVHAKCEVLALNDEGGVSQMAFELIEYEFEVNSEALELDTTKRLIATAVDGELTFAYEGGDAVGQGYEDTLSILLDVPMDAGGDGEDTNVIMNVVDPRAVGDEWEMNHAYMAQKMNDDGTLVIDADEINSSVKLLSVEENEAGVRMASIESEATASGIGMAEGQLPAFMSVTDSGLRMRITGQLPLDAGSAYGTQHAEMEMGMIAKGKTPDGQLVEVEAEFEREADVEFMPIDE